MNTPMTALEKQQAATTMINIAEATIMQLKKIKELEDKYGSNIWDELQADNEYLQILSKQIDELSTRK